MHDVAGDEVGDVDAGRVAVADCGGSALDFVVQQVGGAGCAVFVDGAEADGEGYDHADDHRVGVFSDDVGHRGRGQQQDEQR